MEDKNKFLILYACFVVVSICCAILLLGTNKVVNEYREAYNECMEAYYMAQNGKLPLWDGSTLNLGYGGQNDSSKS